MRDDTQEIVLDDEDEAILDRSWAEFKASGAPSDPVYPVTDRLKAQYEAYCAAVEAEDAAAAKKDEE